MDNLIDASFELVGTTRLSIFAQISKSIQGKGTLVELRSSDPAGNWVIASNLYPEFRGGRRLYLPGEDKSEPAKVVSHTYETEEQRTKALKFFTTAIDFINSNPHLFA